MKDEMDNPIKAEKRRKLHQLRALGINPYPYSYDRNFTAGQLREKFGHFKAGDHADEPVVRIAGRVMTVRVMGKAAFFNLQDQSGTIQVYLKTNELTAEEVKCFELLDLG